MQRNLSRRTTLKALGGLTGAGVVGSVAFAGSAAAADVEITASAPGVVKNDRGDLSRLTIDPQFSVTWENLDDYVAKVFYLIEAKVGDGEFHPIYRATPWLPADRENNWYLTAQSGTTGEYTLKKPHSTILAQDDRFGEDDEAPRPLVVADERGRPDYANLNYGDHPDGVSESSYLDGTSMGSAQEAEDHLLKNRDIVLQNNYPAINAGYYGAASGTSALDNDDEGSTARTPVYVRYTFELQRPNGGWVESRGGVENITNIKDSDLVEGNSPIVMNGEDGNYGFGQPEGIPYKTLQAHAGEHVGVLMDTPGFQVRVANEKSTSEVSGTTNAGASGPEP